MSNTHDESDDDFINEQEAVLVDYTPGASDEQADQDVDQAAVDEDGDNDMVDGDNAGDDGDDGDDGEPARDDSARRFLEHNGEPVYCVGVNPVYPDVVVTGGGDDQAYVWAVSTATPLHKLSGHKDTVVCTEFSHDGKYVATGGMDAVVLVWEAETGKQVARLEDAGESIEWMQWHMRGNVLAAGDAQGTVWLWNPLIANPIMCVFSGHAGPTRSGGWTCDGKLVCSGGEDGTVRVWSPKTGQCVHAFQNLHTDAVLSIALSPSQPTVLTASADGSAALLNVETCKVLGRFNPPQGGPVEYATFCPSLPLAVTGSLNGAVCVWDLSTLQIRSAFSHQAAVTRMTWVPNQPAMLVTSSADHSVRVWDARSAVQIAELLGHSDTVLDVKVTSDGKAIISTADDATAAVFVISA